MPRLIPAEKLQLLKQSPPKDGMPITALARKFHIDQETMWNRIRNGDIEAGTLDNKVVLVSEGGCQAYAASRDAKFKGVNLKDRPPRDVLAIGTAATNFHIAAETIRNLIESGEIRAWRNGVHGIVVSKSDVEKVCESGNTRMTAESAPAPADGEPVGKLAKEFGVDDEAIRGWCNWKKQPVLGRKMLSGIGPYIIETSDGKQRHWRGLLVSRADVKACVEAKQNPLNRKFPGVPGKWLADGVFVHDDGRFFFTERYVYDNKPTFGMSERSLCVPVYRARLEVLKAVWPEPGSRDSWTLLVYSRDSLERLRDRRAGREQNGCWLVNGSIWSDKEGLWYSSKFIADKTGKSIRSMFHLLRSSGLTSRFKDVPLANKKGGRPPTVHHESEANSLLGIGGEIVVSSAAPKEDKPVRTRNAIWKKWKASGLSYNGIVQKHLDETGEVVTRACVIKAVKRP